MSVRAWGQLYIQSTIPSEPPVIIGSLWLDTSTNTLKKCTSTSPYTFSVIEGGGSGAPASDTVEALDGSSDAGIATSYSRGDHKHGDVNRPSTEEKEALAGTEGAPGDTNRYVTDTDPRLDNIGDVIGPESSTDNAIARFHETSGAYIQDSGVILQDDGDIIGKSFVATRDGTVSRTGGQIDSVTLTGGRTIVINRSGGYITSITDSTRTWTISRDGNNQITGWTVT
jgi:hypothetical protein